MHIRICVYIYIYICMAFYLNEYLFEEAFFLRFLSPLTFSVVLSLDILRFLSPELRFQRNCLRRSGFLCVWRQGVWRKDFLQRILWRRKGFRILRSEPSCILFLRFPFSGILRFEFCFSGLFSVFLKVVKHICIYIYIYVCMYVYIYVCMYVFI